jgi:hypothetical protein
MYAVEFRAKIKDGMIQIPPEHRQKFKDVVKVIILAKESQPQNDMIERLLNSPLILKKFKPLSREEIYDRV